MEIRALGLGESVTILESTRNSERRVSQWLCVNKSCDTYVTIVAKESSEWRVNCTMSLEVRPEIRKD